jgi:hypothetical protein
MQKDNSGQVRINSGRRGVGLLQKKQLVLQKYQQIMMIFCREGQAGLSGG